VNVTGCEGYAILTNLETECSAIARVRDPTGTNFAVSPDILTGGGGMLDTALLGAVAKQIMGSNTVDADYLTPNSRSLWDSSAALLSRSSRSTLFAAAVRSLRTLILL